MEERINNSINFLRAMHLQAEGSESNRVEIDSETIQILLKLLKDCKDKLG